MCESAKRSLAYKVFPLKNYGCEVLVRNVLNVLNDYCNQWGELLW